ncbi:hypothetical protein D3C76_1790490 [compost metagenome]
MYSYGNKKFIYKQKYNGKIKTISNYVLFYNTIYNTLTNKSCRFDYNEEIINLDPIEEFVVTKKKLQNREFDRVYWKKAGYFEFNRMQ